MVVWRRVYAATGKNRLLCSPLAFMMVAQGFWGVLLLIQHPQGMSSDARSFTMVDGHRDIKLPEEIWDLFKLCVLQMWEPWSVGYFSLTLAFGAFSPFKPDSWSSKTSYILHSPTS